MGLLSIETKVTGGAGTTGKLTAAEANAIVTAVNERAEINSPTFTGTPAAPTPASSDNSTKIATTAFVQAVIALLIDSSPAALNTLNELAAALGDDANFAATMTAALAAKAPLASPALTGVPTAPTAAEGTNTTQIATTAFMQAALSAAAILTCPAARNITINGVTQSMAADRTWTVSVEAETQSALTYSSTVALDFDHADGVRTLALTGNVTFTASNMGAAKQKTVIITADSSARNFTFPAGWVFIGDVAPASIAAGKKGVLTLYCTGSTEASVIATYSAQV